MFVAAVCAATTLAAVDEFRPRLAQLHAIPIGMAAAALGKQAHVQAVSAAQPAGATAAVPTAAPVTPLLRTDRVDGAALPPIAIQGQSAVVVDVDSGEVLWARDMSSRRAPASLAKLLTAMVAYDHMTSLDQPVTVPAAGDVKSVQEVEPNSTVMGLTEGEVLTVRELLTGLFLRSGNDAAESLAATFMPRDRFVDLMNAKARALGMNGSHFTSPVGLDDPAMYSTALDLATAAYAIDTRYPVMAAIADQPVMDIPATPTHKAYQAVNWLHSFFTKYQGATGMKTGFTDDAGGCVVATATRSGRHLIAVVLHSDGMVGDAEKLLDYGFSTT